VSTPHRRALLRVSLAALLTVTLSAVAQLPARANAGTNRAGTTEVISYITWGHSYSAKSRTYHQVRNQRGPLVIYSGNRGFDFVVQANGDLSTSKYYSPAMTACQGGCWLAYWRSHTNSKGVYFSMQSNGELVERASDRKTVLWRTHKAPGTRYNYALTLSQTGHLVEYYSTGNPTTSSHHLVWRTNRAPGAVRVCGGGALNQGSGITSFKALLALDAGIYVKVHNVNVLPLVVKVYRWLNGNDHPVTKGVLPTKTVTFQSVWGDDENRPTVVEMRTDTPAQSVNASALIYGHCWYKA